ncbi:MAG: 4'-phosphopantetheinyl transferase superfamily protein [Treponemataceae bacterium]|nr:4'-phosphopantetheinyl transferase superfamily protein [Treponemataceae bacterium]
MSQLYPGLSFPMGIEHDSSGAPKYDIKTLSEFNKLKIKIPYFSLSHSGDYAASIISDCPVGIDIEKMKNYDKDNNMSYFSKLAKRFFTSEEAKWISNDRLRFYQIWCAKEAFLKCSGLAGKMKMSEFNVIIEDVNNANLNIKYHFESDDNKGDLYTGKILLDKLDESYMIAVCRKELIDTVKDYEILVKY